MRKGNYHIWN